MVFFVRTYTFTPQREFDNGMERDDPNLDLGLAIQRKIGEGVGALLAASYLA